MLKSIVEKAGPTKSRRENFVTRIGRFNELNSIHKQQGTKHDSESTSGG